MSCTPLTPDPKGHFVSETLYQNRQSLQISERFEFRVFRLGVHWANLTCHFFASNTFLWGLPLLQGGDYRWPGHAEGAGLFYYRVSVGWPVSTHGLMREALLPSRHVDLGAVEGTQESSDCCGG